MHLFLPVRFIGLPDDLLAQRFERWVRAANDLTARFSVLTNDGAEADSSKPAKSGSGRYRPSRPSRRTAGLVTVPVSRVNAAAIKRRREKDSERFREVVRLHPNCLARPLKLLEHTNEYQHSPQ